ncbi:MAG: SynChlorMet cassette protein ScmD [Candidatus Omnitrophica bacterium]|nr:SynChlorMet cassette protein ScmD [Candidatus Omnitrophota bacterium]
MDKENNKSNIVVNPLIVLREEFDDWALLFDPDRNDIYTIDPVSVFVWKRLDGKHTPADIIKELRENCEGMPEDASTHVDNFIQELLKRGLAGTEFKAEN